MAGNGKLSPQEETAHAVLWLEAKFLPLERSEKVGSEINTF
jgi:hypothetical protein